MKKLSFLLLLILAASVTAQTIVINEVVSSNKTTLYDENGDASDWIELYNPSNTQVNLNGFYITDDTLKTTKWQFGSRIIQPKGYLIVFASSKDRKGTYDHTNFNVSASGESLVLSDSKGILIDKVNVPASQSDVAYGRETDGAAKWIFQNATPGKANAGKINAGVSDSVSASLTGGFYPSTISLALTAGTSKIYYTLDGNDPDTSATLYTVPISITKTSVLKAVSIKKGYSPSPIFYQTYFINEKTDLPVISLSSDPYNLFDKTYGMYTNYTMDWERPAHIEFYDDAKKFGFAKDCIVNIHGSQSSQWAQKSLAVKFKDGIEALEYPLFPGFDISTFKSFVLRNSGNDWQYTHIRDAMMQTLVKDLDIDYQEYRPATAFINGEYWGIYNIREKVSEHYIASRHGVNPDSIDMLENNMSVIHGDSLHYLKLINYVNTANMETEDAYNFVDSMVDLDECILYFAAQAYYDNMDWPGTNIKYWRERKPTGKWRWIIFDLDFGFGLYAHGPSEDHVAFMFSTVETRYSNPPWSTLLQRKLVANSRIKNRFINQVADLLNTNFKSDKVVSTINTMANRISTEIVKHRKKWSLNGESTAKLITFANERPAYLRTHMRNYFKCGENGQITVDGTEGGKVKLNTLMLQKVSFPWKGTYFDNNKVYLKAIPEPGYKFTGWSGDVISSSDTISLNVVRTKSVYANFSKDSSDSKGVVINEINYNSSAQFNSGDWIELYNRSKQSIDIGNWIVSDSDPAHGFIIPSGTVLEADKYLVVVEDSKLFAAQFPSVKNFIGSTGFGLSGSGELVSLLDKDKTIIDSLTYDDQSPWALDADGLGASLELTDPFSDNSKGENWKASQGHGSPGKVNSVRTSVHETADNIPTKFVLNQNHPNPFNPSTTVSFQLPTTSNVEIKVFDSLGREISTLVDKEMSAGNYELKFDGSGLASGVYFCKMQSGSFISVKKLLLMK